ncbi:hypothetical protein AB205_0166100, partial [Aquarana catesbeiana]
YRSQLTINTAIVYMHRFYMHHSFTKYHRHSLNPDCQVPTCSNWRSIHTDLKEEFQPG